MKIEDRVTQVLEESGAGREKDERFVELRDFYQQMKAEGCVAEPSYTLPPTDTVGRSLYPSQTELRKVQ